MQYRCHFRQEKSAILPLFKVSGYNIRAHHIGNIPVAILFLSGWLYRLLSPEPVIEGFWGMLFGLGVGLFLFSLGGMGGGDVKLMATLGVWIGWYNLYIVILVAACIGTIWGIIKLLKAGELKERAVNFGRGFVLQFIYKVKGALKIEKITDTEKPLPITAVPFGTCLALAMFGFILL